MRYHGKGTLAPCLLATIIACGLQPPSDPAERARQFGARMAQGSRLIESGQYAEATREFQRALGLFPDSAPAHSLLGLCRLRLKQPELARESLQRAVALDPQNLAALCNLGAEAVLERRYPEARAYLERAVAVDPTFASAHFSLGNVLMFQGETGKARTALQRAFELDPTLARRVGRSGVNLPDSGISSLDACLGFARAFAAAGNAEEAARYLGRARTAGFTGWAQLLAEADFEPVRDNPALRPFRP